MKELMRSLLIFLVLAVLTGLAYPFAITGLSRLFFADKAVGSLIVEGGRVVGSALIGQKFTDPRYFHGRPSAIGYDASNSGGTNFGPTNAKFIEETTARVKQVRGENGLAPNAAIPADLVLASASGLDPDISLDAALIQAPRVARQRAVSEAAVKTLVEGLAEGEYSGGQPHVNVMKLNMAADRLQARR